MNGRNVEKKLLDEVEIEKQCIKWEMRNIDEKE